MESKHTKEWNAVPVKDGWAIMDYSQDEENLIALLTGKYARKNAFKIVEVMNGYFEIKALTNEKAKV